MVYQSQFTLQRIVHEADPEYLFSPLDGEAKLERHALEFYFPTNYTGEEAFQNSISDERPRVTASYDTACSFLVTYVAYALRALQISILLAHRVSGEEVDFWSPRAITDRSSAKRYSTRSPTSTS